MGKSRLDRSFFPQLLCFRGFVLFFFLFMKKGSFSLPYYPVIVPCFRICLPMSGFRLMFFFPRPSMFIASPAGHASIYLHGNMAGKSTLTFFFCYEGNIFVFPVGVLISCQPSLLVRFVLSLVVSVLFLACGPGFGTFAITYPVLVLV